MATSTTNAWVKGFSENPRGRTLRSKSIIRMLERIGSERVRPPGVPPEDPDVLLITRRELLARVLWTRAIVDADNTSTKLIIEYLDGKPGETEGAPGEAPVFHADDMALAEVLLREDLEGAGHGDAGTRGHGEEDRDAETRGRGDAETRGGVQP